MRYLINRQGQEFGPYSEEQIIGYLRSGNVLATDLCWREGMAEWAQVGQLAAFAGAAPAAPSGGGGSAAGAGVVVPGRESPPRAKTGHVGTIRPVKKVTALAVVGMILGGVGVVAVVVGLVLLVVGRGGGAGTWVLGGLAIALALGAIVLGHCGQAAIRTRPEVVKGGVLAVLALLFGYVGFAGGAAVIGLPATRLVGAGQQGNEPAPREEVAEAILLALLEYAAGEGGELPERLGELEELGFLNHAGALEQIAEGRWGYWGSGHQLDGAGGRTILEDLAGQPAVGYSLDDLNALRGGSAGAD